MASDNGDQEEEMDISDELPEITTPTSSARRRYDVVEDMEELPAKKKLLLDTLINFYKDGSFERIVLPIIHDRKPLAIRDIDWLVTNYSLAFPVVYQNPMRPNGEPFNVHSSYVQFEETWKKRLFDPFQRGQRIMFYVNGKKYETTIAQLNFFRWAIQFGVIEWAKNHKKEIREHHFVTKTERKKLIQEQPNREKKRMRLTKNDKSKCMVYIQPMQIHLTDKKQDTVE